MGRKPKGAGGTHSPDLHSTLPLLTDEETPAVEEAAEDGLFTWQDGPNVRVRVDRQDDVVKKWVFHGYVSQEQATEAYIGAQLGGGNYRAQLTQQDTATGRWTIRRQRFFAIPGNYKPPERPLGSMKPAMTRGDDDAANRSPGTDVDLAPNPNAILSNALVSQVMDLMKMSKQQSAGPAFDWGPIIVAGLGLVQKFIETRPRESPEVGRLVSEIDQLRQQVASLQRAPGPTTTAIGDVIGALQQLRGVSDLLGGGGERDKPEDDGLMTLGTQMLALINSRQPQAAPVPVPVPTGGVAEVAALQRATTGGPMPEPWKLLLRPFAPQLVNAAAEGFDPEETADGIYQLMPSKFAPALGALLQLPNATSLVLSEIPALQPHGAWVQALVEALRVIESGADDDDSPGDPMA